MTVHFNENYSAFPGVLILVALTVPHSWAPFVHFSAQSSFQVEHHLPYGRESNYLLMNCFRFLLRVSCNQYILCILFRLCVLLSIDKI